MSLGIPLIIIVLLIIAAWWFLRMAKGPKDPRDNVERDDAERLRYRVPTGQDPAVVVSALTKEGYTAESVLVPEGHDVLIAFEGERERERARVREVIAAADVSAIGAEGTHYELPPVRFLDEPGNPDQQRT